MTVDHYTGNGAAAVAVHVGTGADAIHAWAQAASDAHKLVTPLVGTDFVPAHFRPKITPNSTAEERDAAYRQATASATAAVLYGAEAGLSPLQALQGIYVISGRPAMYARTMLALVLSKGHEVWTEDVTDSRAVVCARRKGSEHVERVIFTMDQAKRAGYTTNTRYQKGPQDMLLARAQAGACRRVAPDALLGMAYAAEELLDDMAAESGEPAARRTARRVTAVRQLPEPVEPAAAPAEPGGPPLPGETGYDDEPAAEPTPEGITAQQQKKLHATFGDLGIKTADRDRRLAIVSAVLGRDVASSADLSVDEASFLIDQLVGIAAADEPDLMLAELLERAAEPDAEAAAQAAQNATR